MLTIIDQTTGDEIEVRLEIASFQFFIALNCSYRRVGDVDYVDLKPSQHPRRGEDGFAFRNELYAEEIDKSQSAAIAEFKRVLSGWDEILQSLFGEGVGMPEKGEALMQWLVNNALTVENNHVVLTLE